MGHNRHIINRLYHIANVFHDASIEYELISNDYDSYKSWQYYTALFNAASLMDNDSFNDVFNNAREIRNTDNLTKMFGKEITVNEAC